MPSETFPNDLEIYRNRMRLTRQQAAHLLGHKDTSNLSRLEHGRAAPTLRTALRLAAIYRVPVDFLYPRILMTERDGVRGLEDQISEDLKVSKKNSLISNTHVLA